MKTLYRGGDVVTMSNEHARAECLVTDGGTIVHAGPLEQGLALVGPGDATVDLAGRTLLPGFIDPHGHMEMVGQFARCADLGACSGFDEIVDVLARHLDRHGPGRANLLIGVNYDHNLLGEGRHPDRSVLDRVSDALPVYIAHRSMHMGVGNGALMRLAGIDAATPDPAGGRLGRTPGSDEPDGYVEEIPAIALLLAPFSVGGNPATVLGGGSDPAEAVLAAQDVYFAQGITTCQDGASSRSTVEALVEAGASGRLLIDVVAYPVAAHDGPELLAEHADRERQYRDHVRVGGLKLILDGSPQGRSAWLSEPYEGGEGHRGYQALPDDVVHRCVRTAVEGSHQLLTHCNGDAASEQLLDAYERVLAEAGRDEDLRPVMLHAQTVRDDQLDRMARIGMIPSFFVGHTWFWGDVHLRNLGPVRGRRISPVRSALDRGLPVTLHQDAPVTPPDMRLSLWAAVNRRTRTGRPIGPEQAITPYEALRAITAAAAYQYFEEDTKGVLAVGGRADLVVLDHNPLTVHPDRLKDLRVELTVKDGAVVHQA